MYLQTRNKFINIQVELNDILERIVNEKLHSRPINDFFFFLENVQQQISFFRLCLHSCKHLFYAEKVIKQIFSFLLLSFILPEEANGNTNYRNYRLP